LAPNAAVMSWRGVEGGIAAAKSGHDAVMAAGTHLYFDHPQTIDNATDPQAHSDLTITLEMVYSFEPIPKNFTPEEAKHILGAQAQSWSDTHPTEANIEWMVYPRSCALSEITWSPAASRDYYAFFQRMLVHEKRLKEMGINARPLNTIPQPKNPS
jgi:hexosaminidase